MVVCLSPTSIKDYERVGLHQEGTKASRNMGFCTTGSVYYRSIGEEYLVTPWSVGYWRSFIETAETFLQLPTHIITPRELSYMFAGVRQSVLKLDEYIDVAMGRAKFEQIEDEEPFYAEVPGLPGVWATGRTQDECRTNLRDVIDGWIEVRQRRGLQIPSINNHRLAD